MNVKNLFRKAIPLTVAAAFALSLGACKDKEQTVSKEDAYSQLKSALTSTTETKELSASILGKYTSKTPVSPEDGESADSSGFEETKGTIDISVQMKADESNKITAQSLWIKLLDEDKNGLILESYYKDGNSYSYSNLIKDSYSYTEEEEPSSFDPSDIGIEDFSASVDKVLEVIPEAKSTIKDGEYQLVWTVNNANLQQYIEAFLWISADDSANETQIKEQAGEIVKDVTLGETFLTVKIKDSLVNSISAVFDVTYQDSHVKGDCNFKMTVKNVSVVYPEGRLEEIKQKAEAEK